MTLDVRNLLQAAKEECGNGRDKGKTELVITQLGLVISNMQPQTIEDGVSDWARLVCFRASLQIKIRQAGTAAQHLEPLVRNGGLLNRDPVAHTTYANALINAGQAGTAAQHLEPLVRNGGLLNSNPVGAYSLCKALYLDGKKNAAIEYGMKYIRETQASNDKEHIIGVGILLAIFDEDEPSIAELKADLVNRYGQSSLDSAKNIAAIWHQNSQPFLALELTSSFYYGLRGTPLAVITDGGYRPISRSDRLKAGFVRDPT